MALRQVMLYNLTGGRRELKMPRGTRDRGSPLCHLRNGDRRHGELFQRLEQHPAAGDSVRTQLGPALTAGIEAFRSWALAVEQARTASPLAQTALDVAEESFDRLVEKVYAALIDRTGRKAAERFFPKPARRKSRPEADPQDTTTPEA